MHIDISTTVGGLQQEWSCLCSSDGLNIQFLTKAADGVGNDDVSLNLLVNELINLLPIW